MRSIASVAAAARVYNVPRSTLRGRVNGALSKPITRGNRLKLSQLDESLLTKWILSIDNRGAAPRPLIVRRIANLLLSVTSTDTVSVNFIRNYIKRTLEVQTRFSRRYKYSRIL